MSAFITCPACGYVDRETADYPDGLARDGDTAETWCDVCDARFTVTVSVTYDFSAAPSPSSPSKQSEAGIRRCEKPPAVCEGFVGTGPCDLCASSPKGGTTPEKEEHDGRD